MNLPTPFVDIEEVIKYKKITDNEEKLPSNPIEYLKRVMKEAESLPDVIVANVNKPVNTFAAQTNVAAKVEKEANSSTNDVNFKDKTNVQLNSVYKISKVWAHHQITKFAQAREQFARHMANLKSISRQTKKRPKLPIYPLPPWDDEKSWFYFCFGNQISLYDEKVKDVYTEPQDKSDSTTIAHGDDDKDDRIIYLQSLETGFPPLMRILLRMDMNQIEANLEYHVQWMIACGFSHLQGRWIYALLCALQKPVYPTVTSILRDIARACKEIRNIHCNKEENKSEILALNVIISIISIYFNKSDLCDSYHQE